MEDDLRDYVLRSQPVIFFFRGWGEDFRDLLLSSYHNQNLVG